MPEDVTDWYTAPLVQERAVKGMTARRWAVVVVLLALPFIIAPPYHYWMFHVAGGWKVSTDLEPEHRAVHLAELFFGDILAFGSLTDFAAFVLLFVHRFHRWLVGALLVPMSLLALAGSAWLLIGVTAYFQFSGH